MTRSRATLECKGLWVACSYLERRSPACNWLRSYLQCSAILTVLIGLALPSSALANDSFAFSDRPLTLNVVARVATPVGELGVVAEYDLGSRFAVGAGAGANIY